MEDSKNNIKDQVFEKINKGELNMKPKAYFVAKVAILVFITAVTFIVSALLISYIIFSMHEGGNLFLLSFGARGLYRFFLIFPWILLCSIIILIFVLEWLLNKFRFGYNKPLVYLFLGTLVFLTVVGSLIDLTSFHGMLLKQAEEKKFALPGFYTGIRKSYRNIGVYRGTVTEISTSTFTISHDSYDLEPDYGVIQVLVPENLYIESKLSLGEDVLVAGDLTSDGLRAFGIHKITSP
jgi:hypothetical protein